MIDPAEIACMPIADIIGRDVIWEGRSATVRHVSIKGAHLEIDHGASSTPLGLPRGHVYAHWADLEFSP